MTDDREAKALKQAHEFNAKHREHIINIYESGAPHDLLDKDLANLILNVQEEAQDERDDEVKRVIEEMPSERNWPGMISRLKLKRLLGLEDPFWILK